MDVQQSELRISQPLARGRKAHQYAYMYSTTTCSNLCQPFSASEANDVPPTSPFGTSSSKTFLFPAAEFPTVRTTRFPSNPRPTYSNDATSSRASWTLHAAA
jgi:hypothetical protein